MIKMQKKTVLFGAAAIMALGLVAVPVQLDSEGLRIDTAAAAGKGGGMKNECRTKGNNGWGNGGEDGTNAGSFRGAQADSKSADAER